MLAAREQATAVYRGVEIEFDAAHRDGFEHDAEGLIGFALPVDWADLEAAAWTILSGGTSDEDWPDVTADWVVGVLLWEGMEAVLNARLALTRPPADAWETGARVRLREHVTALFGPPPGGQAPPVGVPVLSPSAPGPVAPVLRLVGAR